MNKGELLIKRVFDVFFSAVVIIILSPLLLITALCIKLFMPGPVFFKQIRAGRGGKPFSILKFRSMKVDKAAEESFDFSKDSQRITRFGRFIRRTKIDELPQLINVIKGDMSLVGPRPAPLIQTEQYSEYQEKRLLMRPGMTGLAQVNGNIALTWEQRIEYDVRYIHSFSCFLDLKILFKTVLIVLFGEAAFAKLPQKEYEADEINTDRLSNVK